MQDRISIGDLDAGFVKCESCGHHIRLMDCEALSVCKCPSCGTPNFIPFKVSGYWLYQPLGGGGMGRVYKARAGSGAGDFAVKLLPGAMSSDSRLIENLAREAEAGKALGSHRNIVSVIDYGNSDGGFFIVSEFSEGERLDNLIASRKRYEEKEAWQLALQIIEAERHIISRGYLFRDLKPENIMVNSKGQLKLYDYGLCLPLADATSGIAHSEHIEGSPFYLPPERVVGAPEGEYSEIYSLGMVVFHMLAGKTYYSEAEIKDLISKHVTSLRISTVETHLRHCTRRSVEILDKMIKRRPNDRYHSFDALKADVEQMMQSLGSDPDTSAPPMKLPPESLDAIAKAGKRRSNVVLTVALLAIFAVLLAVFLARSAINSKKRKDAYIQIASSIGVNPGVEAPTKSIQEIKALIAQEVDRKLAEELRGARGFDAKAAEAEALKQLAISGKPRNPSISLAQLEEGRKKELAEKEANALASLKKDFNEDAARAEIVRKIGLSEPIAKPDCSLGQALERFQTHIEEKAKEKFSQKELALRIKNAYDRYRGFYKGETVKTMDGAGNPVSGTFDGKSGAKVIIGGRKILLRDIPATQRWRFDEALSQKKVASETEKVKTNFEAEKQKFKTGLEKTGKDNYLKSLGFIKDSKGDYSLIEDFLKEETSKARSRHDADIKRKQADARDRIAKEMGQDPYYRKNGFCKFQNRWMPEGKAVEKYVQDKKDAFDAENKKKLSAIRKTIEAEVEKKLMSSNGYVFHGGAWQPSKDLLDRLVEARLSE